MTSQEAYQGIRQIESYYGGQFLPTDIAPIWSELLSLPAAALNHAIGEMKIIWKRMPAAEDLLSAVKRTMQKMELQVVDGATEEGHAVFALMEAWWHDKISESEYVKGLYALASVYGNPEYAHDAANREAEMKERGP